MGHYLTACICLNGHVVTDSVEKGFGTPHCSSCGEKTITSCPDCNTKIRGEYEEPSVVFIGSGYSPAPPYCVACGKAYPWTQRKLDGVAELAAAIDELTDYERSTLDELMPHIVEETPRTPAAGFKIAAIVQRVTGPAKKVLTEAIVAVAVEAGKKAMGLG
jgi:hypothetical protein